MPCPMRLRTPLLALALIVGMSAAVTIWWSPWVGAQGGPPPLPGIYSGTVTVGGAPAPDGLQIVGRILDYESSPVLT